MEAWSGGGEVGNTPPTVSLTAPIEGATFTAPASIPLTASASDPGGSVSLVTFYANGNPIGSDTTSPYSWDWTNVAAGSYALTAVALDNLGATTTSSAVNVTVMPPASGGPVNVAAAAAGGLASASSTYSAGSAPAGANDGDRRGLNWGSGGGWADGTANVYPDYLQIDFNANRTITEVDVFTVQDSYWAPVEPTLATTFNDFGIRDFEVQYWNGSGWLTIPGTTVTGNNLVWRRFTFAAITTTRIRVAITQALAGYSRITEVEAWTP